MTLIWRWQRFWRVAPPYLRTVARREWQLIVLALGGLAPGVAALTAWVRMALWIDDARFDDPLRGWLLPVALLDLIGPKGVLLGVGVVTLLIGCLSLTNVYLASLKRRAHEFALLMTQGLSRREMMLLLLFEILGVGVLGGVVGALCGILLSEFSWSSAVAFFQPQNTGHPLEAAAFLQLWWHSLRVGIGMGLLATLLFMGLSAVSIVLAPLPHLLRGTHQASMLDRWGEYTTSGFGTLFAALLTLVVAWPMLNTVAVLVLSGLALLFAALLSGGGWLLAHLYRRLPTSGAWPLWSLAVQGVIRHPNHTAAMTLALTAGAYSVGLAALAWLGREEAALFTFWVAGMVLVSGASLVLTLAALAALERRWEFGLIMALGARARRVWQLILLEYAIVAVGSGSLGALMALVNWAGSHGSGDWPSALAVVLADLIAALLSAWVGAAPVLWRVTRRTVGQAVKR